MQAVDIKPLDFFLLRTPALPYNQAAPWTEVIGTPAFQRALFFSSPDLYELLQDLLAGRLGEKSRVKVEKSLYKYWLRMSFRSTPFGLMAGPSLGSWGRTTGAKLLPAQAREYVRLDMGVVCQLIERLEQHSQLRQHLRFFPNNTIYFNHSKIRYIEPLLLEGYVQYQLAGVERTDYVERVLARAQTGATLLEIAEVLVEEDVSLAEAQDFVDDIVAARLLSSELMPRISDPAFEGALLTWLQGTIAAHSALADPWLLELLDFLTELQQSYRESALTVDQVKALGIRLQRLEIRFSLKTLLQVDLFPEAVVNELESKVFDELRNSLALLWGTTGDQQDPQLTRFKEAFLERYEEEEIPLLLVLDSETGLGFPVGAHHDASALIEGLLSAEPPEMGRSALSSTEWEAFLYRKYEAALATGTSEIRLTDEEVKPFVSLTAPRLPFSLSSNVQVFQAPDDSSDFRLYHVMSDGPSCSTLLGRFCCGDAQLQARVEAALVREQEFYADQIIAEIIHLPQSRIGNIIMRPKLRGYEIPVLSAPHRDSQQLPLADLLVSVRNNRIVLRSQSLGREIIPSLSSAHNYSLGSLPLYHFLACLQYQGLVPSYVWNWGLLRHATYLPRVVLNRTILARASWALNYEAIFKGRSESITSLRAYLQTTAIPRFVTFQEMDNQLPIDLENDLALSILLDQLRKDKKLWLREDLFKVLASPVTDVDGASQYNNEYSIPWEYAAAHHLAPLPAYEAAVARDFAPGSEWVYLKLYCGVKLGDELLIQVIKPFADELLVRGVINQWFFIRYADPHSHLRIRFRQCRTGTDLVGQLHAHLAPYLHDKSIWRVQQDTYKREIERYGAATVDAVEEWFFHDSVAVAELLTALEEDSFIPRWRAALVGIDCLLDDFGLSLRQKGELVEHMAMIYGREFNMDNSAGHKSLGAKFRANRADIEHDLQARGACGAIFKRRSTGSRAGTQAISSALNIGTDIGPAAYELIGSCIHMFVNRVFRSQQRLHELALCDLLHRSYASLQARGVKLSAQTTSVV